MWKRNALCSNGVPCLSRIRNRIRPASASSISSLRRAKLTRAAFTTERSVAIASSRRTNPWSRTGMLPSATTSDVTATRTSLARVPDGLLPALERRYELGPLEPGERLAGGYANDIFGLDAPSGPVVMRLQHPPLQPERLRWEHGVIRRLAERLTEVPAPLAASDRTTFFEHDGYAVWLLPFVDGAPGQERNARERLEAAALLGRLHRAGLELAPKPWPGQRHVADLAWPDSRREYGGELAGRNAEIDDARAWALAF